MRAGFLLVSRLLLTLCVPASQIPCLAFRAPPKLSFEGRQGSLLLSYLFKVCLLGEQRHWKEICLFLSFFFLSPFLFKGIIYTGPFSQIAQGTSVRASAGIEENGQLPQHQ